MYYLSSLLPQLFFLPSQELLYHPVPVIPMLNIHLCFALSFNINLAIIITPTLILKALWQEVTPLPYTVKWRFVDLDQSGHCSVTRFITHGKTHLSNTQLRSIKYMVKNWNINMGNSVTMSWLRSMLLLEMYTSMGHK